jgi:hypothetical protein
MVERAVLVVDHRMAVPAELVCQDKVFLVAQVKLQTLTLPQVVAVLVR